MDIDDEQEVLRGLELPPTPHILVYKDGKLAMKIPTLYKTSETCSTDTSGFDPKVVKILSDALDKLPSQSEFKLKFKKDHNYRFIGAAVGHCAGVVGCQFGPSFTEDLLGISPYWDTTINFNGRKRNLEATEDLIDFSTDLALATSKVLKEGKKFITIGGDHSCAIGTWSGVHDVIGDEYGLIWIDAHMDAHTPESDPFKNIHGQPVSHLVGKGEKRLSTLLSQHPKLKPENLIMIGQRSYEDPEPDFLKDHKIKVFLIDEVHEKGFDYCWKYALDRFASKKLKYGISFDLDGLDPVHIDALGTPEPNGIALDHLTKEFREINYDDLIGVEITEYNPTIDTKHKGAICIKDILESIPRLTQ